MLHKQQLQAKEKALLSQLEDSKKQAKKEIDSTENKTKDELDRLARKLADAEAESKTEEHRQAELLSKTYV